MPPARIADQLRARLSRLAQRAEGEATWRSERSAPFLPGALPARIPKRRAIGRVSLLYHGEVLTARLCGRLARQVPLAEAQRCLALQQEDEAAHADLYADYLAKLGGVAPRHSALDLLEQELDRWQGAPEAEILAVHLLLEGEAVALQRSAGAWLPCTGFRALNAQVARDEGRHIAFGKLYLPQALRGIPRQERLAIHAWLRDLWWRAFALIHEDNCLVSFIVAPGLRLWARRRWRYWQGELMRIGLYDESERRLFERG